MDDPRYSVPQASQKEPNPKLWRFSRKAIVITILKILISGVIIGVLFSKIGLRDVTSHLTEMAWLPVALALALALSQSAVLARGWELILRRLGAGLSLRFVFKVSIISLFFNQILPASLGGIGTRVYLVHRANTDLAIAATSVLLERIAHFLTFLCVVLLTQPFLYIRLDESIGFWTIFLATAGAAFAIAFLILADRIPAALLKWRIVRTLTGLSVSARKVFLWPWGLVRLAGWSVLWHVLNLGVMYALVRGLAIDIHPMDFLAVLPPALLVGSLPISINGWGVREAAMVGFLSLIDISADQALALSITFGFVILVSRLPGAMVWFLGTSRKTVPVKD